MPTTQAVPIEFIAEVENFENDNSSIFDTSDRAIVINLGDKGQQTSSFDIHHTQPYCASGMLGENFEPGEINGIDLIHTGASVSGSGGQAKKSLIFPGQAFHRSAPDPSTPYRDFETLFRRGAKMDNFQSVTGITCFENLNGLPVLFQLYYADLHI